MSLAGILETLRLSGCQRARGPVLGSPSLGTCQWLCRMSFYTTGVLLFLDGFHPRR